MGMAVILNSGGIDSCVLASIAAQTYQLAFLHVDYQHLARERERKAFDKQVQFFQPKHTMVLALEHFKQIGGCGLVDPKYSLESLSDFGNQLPRSYLPFGFPLLWSLAAGWAQTLGAQVIYFGGSEDYGLKVPAYGKIEPSIDREVIQLFNFMLHKVAPPGLKINLELPLLAMKRSEILNLAQHLKSPLERTWSCYRQGPNPCMQCYRCQTRQQSFKAAGLTDPLEAKRG